MAVRDTQKNLKENMHINTKPSSIIMVIERIYHPIAQNMGISLLLRNEINAELQFPPNFFINLIQVTGNLVANAVKFTPPNGMVDVVFTLDTNEEHSLLYMTVTSTEKIISPDLLSAINQGKKVPKLTEPNGEPDFDFRLRHVMQIVSKEGGRILVENEEESGTKFLLSFPLPEKYLKQRTSFHPILKNSEVYLNGS